MNIHRDIEIHYQELAKKVFTFQPQKINEINLSHLKLAFLRIH